MKKTSQKVTYVVYEQEFPSGSSCLFDEYANEQRLSELKDDYTINNIKEKHRRDVIIEEIGNNPDFNGSKKIKTLCGLTGYSFPDGSIILG